MKLVVDSSAIVAILRGEPEAERCLSALTKTTRALISAVNYVETGTVLAGRASPSYRQQSVHDLDGFLSLYDIAIAPVTEDHARFALRARIKYGRGFGAPAGLNFGDCFAYALARTENAKLLYVGNDFAMTDVEGAI
ncbi:MAG: type II toxin-antitoxin system VapC family toxin [Hyphomonas sp.]